MKSLFILVLLFVSSSALGESTIGNDMRDGMVESTSVEPVVENGVDKSLRPVVRPKVRLPSPRPRNPSAGERLGGQPPDFSRVSRSVSSAPIWAAFADVFARCAPGCSPQRLGTWRKLPRSGKATSCHHSGKAVDLGGIKCGGTSYNAYKPRFKEFVKCVKGKSFQGKRWKSLYRQTHRGKNNCHTTNRDQTACHWDHVHISFGCSVRGT